MTVTVENLRMFAGLLGAVSAASANKLDDEIAHLFALIVKDDRAAAFVVSVFNRGKVAAAAESIHDDDCPCPECITPKMQAKVEEIAAALPE